MSRAPGDLTAAIGTDADSEALIVELRRMLSELISRPALRAPVALALLPCPDRSMKRRIFYLLERRSSRSAATVMQVNHRRLFRAWYAIGISMAARTLSASGWRHEIARTRVGGLYESKWSRLNVDVRPALAGMSFRTNWLQHRLMRRRRETPCPQE